MRRLTLDPLPHQALELLWARSENVADAVEEVLDWIEAEPPDVRAKRRRFSNGMWAVNVRVLGEEWTVVWEEETPGQPVVRLLAETSSI